MRVIRPVRHVSEAFHIIQINRIDVNFVDDYPNYYPYGSLNRTEDKLTKRQEIHVYGLITAGNAEHSIFAESFAMIPLDEYRAMLCKLKRMEKKFHHA